ncbi:hypothetical protein HC031_20930 [Planosporangium thailandense]|uniref:DUF1269 domain-containing protein n=1 Tax=Planosporangium thailandense TaxID=765197 RepID=A0ABX0Y411_9ACTN|nr:DUF6325 family protein [Planosporangium thailandense]NJC72162.1 hypothetical protein [Planosporangium thailandense]
MTGIGPLEFLVFAFPGEELPDRIAAVLYAVERGGDVRVVDALAVAKDRDGRVRSAELVDVPAVAGLGVERGFAEPGVCLIDAADVDEVGQALDAGTVALAVLVEHAWARQADAVVREQGGALVGAVRIPEAYVAEARASRDVPGHRVH